MKRNLMFFILVAFLVLAISSTAMVNNFWRIKVEKDPFTNDREVEIIKEGNGSYIYLTGGNGEVNLFFRDMGATIKDPLENGIPKYLTVKFIFDNKEQQTMDWRLQGFDLYYPNDKPIENFIKQMEEHDKFIIKVESDKIEQEILSTFNLYAFQDIIKPFLDDFGLQEMKK